MLRVRNMKTYLSILSPSRSAFTGVIARTIFIAAIVGCSDSSNTSPRLTRIDAMSQETGSNQSEDELIESLVSRLPVSKQAEARVRLKSRDVSGAGGNDAQFVSLARELMASRRDRNGRRIDGSPISTAAQVTSAKKSNLTLVDVVLAPSNNTRDPRVSLIRRPGDDGVPVVVLGATDVTPEELSMALKAAAASVKELGDSPVAETRIGIRVKTSMKTNARSNPAFLAHLKANAARTEVSGLGMVRALRVATRAK